MTSGAATRPETPPPSEAVLPDGMSEEENLLAWRTGIASLFDVSYDRDAGPFRAELHGYDMGQFILGTSHASPQAFTRDRQRINAVGVDHLLVQLYVDGTCAFDADGIEAKGLSGDIVCFDLSRQMQSQASDLQIVNLILPRQMLRLKPGDIDTLHGAVLDGKTPLGTLLREHMLSMARVAPRLTGPDSAIASDVAAVMVSAGLSAAVAARSNLDRAELVAPTVQAIQNFIERNLGDMNLSPETLMRQFAISRSALYRIFEPLGGVANYIRDRRLSRSYLRSGSIGTGRGSVARLAYASGFASEQSFARAFRQRYGITPREAIANGSTHETEAALKAMGEDNWLRAWLGKLAV